MKKKIFKVMSLSTFVLIFVLIGLRESKGWGNNYNCVTLVNKCNEHWATNLDICLHVFGLHGPYNNADIHDHCTLLLKPTMTREEQTDFCNKMQKFAEKSDMCQRF